MRIPIGARAAKRSFERLRVAYWSWRFQRSCAKSGRDAQVQGPCVINGGGAIEVGDGLCIRSRRIHPVEISVASEARLSIGSGVFLNQGVRIACTAGVFIGDNCQIGDETVILDSDFHGVGERDVQKAQVRIENNVWLATRVIVLRGVTIGEGSVIGAGSVVTRSIPPLSFAAGAPARVIRSLESHAE